MKINWYGWKSWRNVRPYGWWPEVRWFIIGPLIIEFENRKA